MEWIIIIAYGSSLLVLSIFSLAQFNLAIHYLKKKNVCPRAPQDPITQYPFVTIQLPVYNEQYVIERLLKNIAEIDYPTQHYEVQLLDDSDDETTAIASETIDQIRKTKKININHIRRKNREGFKAGALKYGLNIAKGELIAIFDADFLPKSDFLLKTVKSFEDKSIGVVQTRWGHINRQYSPLTKVQAFGLDAHFSIEQQGRFNAGSFINFNGTAGVWRKTCIESSGGWSADTLTEDLDLSYRAQMKGWKFIYLEDVLSPAELPVYMPAVKSQQYRWNKGAAETAKKNLSRVLKSKLPIKTKTHAFFHLLNSSVFFWLLIAATLSIPMLYLKAYNPSLEIYFNIGSIFIIGFVAISLFYWYSSKNTSPVTTLKYYLFNYPLFLAFSMGLSLHNSIAVVEGYLGIKSSFIRTPKFNILNKKDKWHTNIYIDRKISLSILMEGTFALYFAFGLASAFLLNDFGLFFFHLLLMAGYFFIFYHSLIPVKNVAN
ncbi:MAG TPA: glycosyltransferase [Cyclobacteriaceae bacterium]